MKGCHERPVHMDRRYKTPSELEVLCCEGILNHRAGKAEIKGSPDRCIHTHVAHGSSDHQIVHSLFPQRLEEECFPKAVGEMFLKQFFSGQRFQSAVNLSS